MSDRFIFEKNDSLKTYLESNPHPDYRLVSVIADYKNYGKNFTYSPENIKASSFHLVWERMLPVMVIKT